MRVPLLGIVLATACSGDERTRQAVEFRLGRDSLRSAEVVKALQSPAAAGRLIYERPADLSYDSLRLKRPDLVRVVDRPKP